jgi:uncharacterized membrane protein YGL010W
MEKESKPTTEDTTTTRSKRLLDLIDLILHFNEGLLVLVITWVIICVGWRLIWEQREGQPILKVDWRIFLLLLVPLFFRPIRTFIEEAVDFLGIKRERRGKTSPEEEVEKVKPRQKRRGSKSQEE